MELDKSILLQKQVKDNASDLQSELLDMKNWEEQMKRKEQELQNQRSDEQSSLPPVRAVNKQKNKKAAVSGIKSHDIHEANSSKKLSQQLSDKHVMTSKELSYEKAQKYKQEGNILVQQKNWDQAIAAYNEAIKYFAKDPTFYANRALCYLKQNNFHSAEVDCSIAIKLDDTYVKAYYRRAAASIGLKRYHSAKLDIKSIFEFQPNNAEAKALLIQIDELESPKSITISEENTENIIKPKSDSRIPNWLPEKDNVEIVEPIEKAPHLRSKEPLKRIHVQEADLTKSSQEEIETLKVLSDRITKNLYHDEDIKESKIEQDHNASTEILSIPRTAVQFTLNWRKYTSSDFRYRYLKQLSSGSLPKIFQNSMEPDIFSDILATLKTEFIKKQEPIFSYLKDLSNINRFRAFIMFISNSEKEDLKRMFSYCKTSEKVSEIEYTDLKNKYEI